MDAFTTGLDGGLGLGREAGAARRPSRAEAEAAVRTLIRRAGDDPGRRAYAERFRGYDEDPVVLLERTFGESAGA
jgi:GTP cyclohydrolase I